MLVNDAFDAAFIKSHYFPSTFTNSLNDGGNLKKSLVGLFLHGSRNTSIISQSVLSLSMALCDIQQLFH